MNRRLTRSRTDTVLGGVAAGVARWMDADPALVRIAWAILIPLTGGAAFFVYIVAWIVIPEEPIEAQSLVGEPGGAGAEPVEPTPTSEPRWRVNEGNAGLIVGGGLVLLGVWFLLREYLPDFDWGLVWPLAVIGVGILVLTGGLGRRR